MYTVNAEVRVLIEREKVDKERGGLFKFREKALRSMKLILSIAAILIGTQFYPLHVFASGSWETSATQVKAGTLPLLAALGVGIVVAVASVIAFLQMTAKDKETTEASLMALEDQEPFDEHSMKDWSDEEVADNSNYGHNPPTDYTIPMTRILTYPEQAESADEQEPRLCGLEGEHAGTCYRILNRALTIGRDPAHCVILFPYDSGEISRVHCTLSFREDSRLFILEDNGSSNGTFLANGNRLKPGVRYELRTGERFSLSGMVHMFEVRDEAGLVIKE